MQIVLQIFTLLGALALFLYGMTLMSEGLQKAAGNKLRSLLASMTSTPFKRVMTGLVLTAIVQSSSATTVMVVSFVNAGLLSLGHAIGVIMGANIGTTFTAWIVSFLGFSFNISSLSIPLIAVGFVFMMTKTDRNKNIGQTIIGLALFFLGLSYLKTATPDLAAYPQALTFIQGISQYGFLSLIIFLLLGTALTIIFQASIATLTLTLVMLNFGWISFDMAAAMVLGENIGTTITANLAATVGNSQAKRAALSHTLFNVLGVVWALILFRPFIRLSGWLVSLFGVPNPTIADLSSPDASEAVRTSALYGLSMMDTLFNVFNTLLLIWFVPQMEKILNRIIKTPAGEEEVYRLKYISGGPLNTAELSLDEASQEIYNFGEICYKDYAYIRAAINEQDPDKFSALNQKLVKYEEITDRIEGEIASYLNEVAKGELSARSEERIKSMYKIIGEMESLGDSGEAIGRILQRKNAHGKVFDENMLKRLNEMLDAVDVAYKAMLDNLKMPYYELFDITNAQNAEDGINECRNRLREEHIAAIENDRYNYQTGVYFIDVVAELEKIGDFIINISQAEQAVK